MWIGAAVTAGLFSAGRWLIVLYLGKTLHRVIVRERRSTGDHSAVGLIYCFAIPMLVQNSRQCMPASVVPAWSRRTMRLRWGSPAKSNEAEQQAGKRRGGRLFGER